MYLSNLERNQALTNQPAWSDHSTLAKPNGVSKTDRSPLFRILIVTWLAGTVALLPVKIVNLPSNFELVDIWILIGLPILLLFYSFQRQRIISFSYAVPMWLVMVSTIISTFFAPAASKGVVILFKEAYLFAWFMSATVFLCVLKPRDLRRVFYIWSGVVLLHGLLMIAQFLSPEIWQFTNALGGNTARVEGYRAAGLFICDKAGCANKAAYFQLMGFVPLLLAGFPKKTTAVLGIFLFASMMTSGSMGATLAFLSGLVSSVLVIAFFKKNLALVAKYFLNFIIALSLLAGLFFVVVSQNQSYLEHFEKIIVGRYDKSSGGRFDLWQRGIDALLENNAFLWGVGPDNFRVVDAAQADNQLHNDILAFLVERGLIGLSGLALFAIIGIRSALKILLMSSKQSERLRLEGVVFLAVIVATMVESLTHQMFRTRELWLVLAIQEAVYFGMIALPANGMEKATRTMIGLKQDNSLAPTIPLRRNRAISPLSPTIPSKGRGAASSSFSPTLPSKRQR